MGTHGFDIVAAAIAAGASVLALALVRRARNRRRNGGMETPADVRPPAPQGLEQTEKAAKAAAPGATPASPAPNAAATVENGGAVPSANEPRPFPRSSASPDQPFDDDDLDAIVDYLEHEDEGDSDGGDVPEDAGQNGEANEGEKVDLLDMERLARRLSRNPRPWAVLKRIARLYRPDLGSEDNFDADAIRAYLARGLREAGILDPDAHLPRVVVVYTGRSKTFYLRVVDDTVAWADMLRVLATEGALNRALFAWEHFRKHAQGTMEPEEVTIEDCYRFNQALASSICAQLGSTPIPRASMSDVMGEWGVRQTISAGIETFRLPLRLTAQFRVNLMGGDAAIVCSFVPAAAQPASVYSPELGRIVRCSAQMRDRLAADYAQRCALLLAAHAFRSSRRICHAFVAVTLETPSHHTCLLSGDVSREQLRELDLSEDFDAAEVCARLGVRCPTINGRLSGTEQGFELDSERFCPRGRYESVDLSSRVLPSFEARLLGVDHVSEMSINESARRELMAQRVVRELGGSTERSVRRILRLTENDADPTVVEAGKRCTRHIIEGSLSTADQLAFVEDFVEGDELSRGCDRATDLLQQGKASEAIEVLCDLLAPIDALDTYRDGDGRTWRQFMSYVSRTLYNRLMATEGEKTQLVPDAYYGAQLLMSSALLERGRVEEALAFARRAQELDPLDMAAMLRIVRCHELLDDNEAAAEELRGWLEVAFDPQGVGVGYYRLAYLEWQLGNIEVADACYQKAAVSRATCAGAAALELHALRALEGERPVEGNEVDEVLEAASVPLAPTERVIGVLVEAAQGSLDAEVFPVARSFATLLGSLTGDDVMNGVMESIEHEPDR